MLYGIGERYFIGNGDWDGVDGDPTYMTLTLGGLAADTYSWTSYHHDTENVHGPFAVWISTDGGETFTQLDVGTSFGSARIVLDQEFI